MSNKLIYPSRFAFTFFLLLVGSLSSTLAIAGEIYPGAVWKDDSGVAINAHGGGLLYHDGTYYWYGEHKMAGRRGNSAMVGVHCYSSENLYDWTDRGIVLPVSSDRNSEIARGCILERPKVIYNEKTKKFVMWFHLEFRGLGYATARSGVAVSDSPTGEFTYIRSVRPNAGVWPANLSDEEKSLLQPQPGEESSAEQRRAARLDVLYRDFDGGQMARDMTVFVDDDGKAYHLFASEENQTLHIVLLADDYLSHTDTYVRVFPYRNMEAPAVFKHDGRYYFLASGCTGWAPNAARSAVAENILGPWQELGNPMVGRNPRNGLGPEKTFGGQSTYIQKVHGKQDAFIAMFDIWNPSNPIDGRYVWLPIKLKDERFEIHWLDTWDLSIFDQ